jgi:tetratricopeptide (TPR) repeat protein
MGIARGIALLALVGAVASPASALTEDEERAKAHFLAGQSYYDQASYADALKEFTEAFRISHRPALLYNIARCYEGMDQLDKAIENLEGYLRELPQADDREAVQSRIKNLQDRLQAMKESTRMRTPPHPEAKPPLAPQAPASQPSPPVAAPAPAASPSPPAPARHRRWTWIVGGIGVGALAAALGTGIASQLSYNDVGNKCSMSNVCAPGLSGQIDSGKQLALATDVLWPIGAAAMVTAIVLFVVEGRPASSHARLMPSTGGVAFAF